MSFSDKDVSEQRIQEKINELRTIAMFGIDGMKAVLKIRALVILGS